MTTLKIGVAALFVLSILAANYLTTFFGFVPVGFGLTATAGTFAAGLTLALRDAVQDAYKRRSAVLVVIALGAVLSLLVADATIAIASGAAFLISELIDYAVYTPLRERARFGDKRWTVAVAASNIVGAIVDTIVFIGLAFGYAAIQGAIAGQFVGKMIATFAFILVVKLVLSLRRDA